MTLCAHCSTTVATSRQFTASPSPNPPPTHFSTSSMPTISRWKTFSSSTFRGQSALCWRILTIFFLLCQLVSCIITCFLFLLNCVAWILVPVLKHWNAMRVCRCRVDDEFMRTVRMTVNGVCELQETLFPLQCLYLREAISFRISFSHDLQPTKKGQRSWDYKCRFAHCSEWHLHHCIYFSCCAF